MPRAAKLFLILAFLSTGCSGAFSEPPGESPQITQEQVQPTPAAAEPEESEQPTDERPEDIFGVDKLVEIELEGRMLTTQSTEYFTGAGNCTNCHREMTDQNGKDVSIDAMWRSAVMANAGRDPYFKAAVKREVEDLPEYQDFIEDKCATCHMPMARTTAHFNEQPTAMFNGGFYNKDHYLHEVAMDGISCTVCHQIQDGNFGTAESYSGGFLIDQVRPAGTRYLYGTNPVTDRRAAIMAGPSGYTPVEVEHIQQSELCATCHTLFTPAIDENGEIFGEFPEQMPYLEWLESSHVAEGSCQDCHMPPADGGVVLSITGGEPISPFNQHLFIGANTYILRILRQFGEELGVTASSEAFQDKIVNTQEQLENNAARVSISEVEMIGDTMQAVVEIENLAGHKLPTGFPSRRIWIHFTVRDADGSVIFESGDYQADGMILENDNDQDPRQYERHYDLISQEDQVQIYEPILVNSLDEVTTHLLRVSYYVKDNRLLPDGFDKQEAAEEIDVHGQAGGDEDFQGGGDRLMYRVNTENAQGPLTIEVELLMQSIGFRWAVNHREVNTSESETFMKYYDATSNLPVLLSEAEIQLENGE
jgi:hypothetical protein